MGGTFQEQERQKRSVTGNAPSSSSLKERPEMERHRCSKCRNPIRQVGTARRGSGEDIWYHPDCWVEVCATEQENYQREVESVGLAALLAPYLSAASEALDPLEQEA